MKRGTIIITIAAVLLIGVAAVYVLTKKASAPAPTTSNTTNQSASTDTASQNKGAEASASNQVNIENFAFSSANITVKKGTTVTWTNKDSVQHSVIGDTDDGPKSSLLSQGSTYSFTFETAGVFTYHCGPHPQMTGKVTVTE